MGVVRRLGRAEGFGGFGLAAGLLLPFSGNEESRLYGKQKQDLRLGQPQHQPHHPLQTPDAHSPKLKIVLPVEKAQ